MGIAPSGVWNNKILQKVILYILRKKESRFGIVSGVAGGAPPPSVDTLARNWVATRKLPFTRMWLNRSRSLLCVIGGRKIKSTVGRSDYKVISAIINSVSRAAD